jgi:hypothetical protein
MYHVDIDVRLKVEGDATGVFYSHTGSLRNIHVYDVDTRDGGAFLEFPLQEQRLPGRVQRRWNEYGSRCARRENARRGF